MIKRMLCLVITISLASQASAVLIGGIDFPGGAASFADAVDVTPDLHVFEIGCSATIRPPPSYCLILKSN